MTAVEERRIPSGQGRRAVIEGFGTLEGPTAQMDVLRTVSKVPIKAALSTHYRFDHSMGNSYYGANGIP